MSGKGQGRLKRGKVPAQSAQCLLDQPASCCILGNDKDRRRPFRPGE